MNLRKLFTTFSIFFFLSPGLAGAGPLFLSPIEKETQAGIISGVLKQAAKQGAKKGAKEAAKKSAKEGAKKGAKEAGKNGAKEGAKEAKPIKGTQQKKNKDQSNIQKNKEYKKPKSGLSEKEGSKERPSWAEGKKPYTDESGKDFAKRLLDEKYGKKNHDTGPTSEFNQLKKYGDRSFE